MKNKIILLTLLVSIGLIGVYFFAIKDNRTIENHEDASNYNKVIEKSKKKPSVTPKKIVTPKTADKLRHQENEEITNHIAAFESAFYSQNREQLFKEAEAIKKLGKEAIPQLLNIVSDKKYEPVFRQMAFELIRDTGLSVEEVGLLIGIMNDKTDDPLIRGEAALALGLTGSIEAVNPLIEVLSNKEEDTRIRKLSAISLGLIKDARAENILIQTVNHYENDNKVRSAAVEALGYIHTHRGLDTLLASLNDQSWEVQIAASRGLSGFGGDKAVQALNNQLLYYMQEESLDTNDAVVKSIIDSLSSIKSTESVTVLIKVLEGTDQYFSSLAGEALGEIGDRRAIVPIEEVLNNAIDPFQTKILTEALKKLSE